MVAALWTAEAEDITSSPSRWPDFLTVGQLSNLIKRNEATIIDGLARRASAGDPRSAINRPAARIGASRIGATPMWHPEQAENFLDMLRERAQAQQTARRQPVELPILAPYDAAKAGLATIEELVEITGRPDSGLRRWARENDADSQFPFPAEEAVAARIPPLQFGPPRKLRSIAKVVEWIEQHARDRAA